MVHTLPHGTWPSPLDAATAAAHDGRPDHVGFVGDEPWWTEPRPTEGGRRTLVRRTADGRAESVLPAPWNVRSRVHEYGGHPWAGTTRPEGPLVVFSEGADQRLYAHEPDVAGAGPRPLTPLSSLTRGGGGLRWVNPVIRAERGEVWCVLEEFTGDGPGDVRRVPVAVPLDGSAAEDRAAVRELTAARHRFVTGPRPSPDGRRAAWLAWDHPRMPWDGTELLVADIGDDGLLHDPRTVAGGPEESIAQADWAADGTLLYVSDRSGWWNPYRLDDTGRHHELCPREEEFGGPLWTVGQRWFAPLAEGLVAVVHGRGTTALGILDPETGEVVDAAGPWSEFAPTLAVHGSRIVGVGAGPRSAPAVIELDARTGRARVIGAEPHDPVDPAYYPEPQLRTFTGPDGRDVHARLYPPHNPGYTAPGDELPPYVVWAHGGPTGRAPVVLDLGIAYFTSRGIGVAEVDYGGSTGYGREYRERLREQWGVVDVEDCAAVALALAEEGTADRRRLAVRGGSAGGWTAAVSLATTDVYACGTILYPVLDLVGWAEGGTHDFESRYLDGLVGPLSGPDAVPGRYAERSPVERADGITVPFLLLQGLDDVICPPAQCERLLERMAGRGVRHAYLTFEGEGHGFRRAETTVRALEAELGLYAEVFGLPGVQALELRGT
ncbi:dipeptidyl aminopeptidase/acylaminoacyl peptidase [Streptomyces sp. B3I7]|uniref:prolyl oligopeptidase family serine peptidase n=1 Tax=Streptomyces sp. B3I7 TaxID=3042269 RepID=UPI0027840C17|nr:prolyl oligopeptidase family serine peptidase [Streptomyces sp. B3I7]MDQ0810110.1 dipeptidyl aminopeptidase/acylaminoacyl peptidase [Streptomyces sp. B3I7]